MQQVVVGGIIDPAFDGNGVVCGTGQMRARREVDTRLDSRLTFMKNIAHGTIIQNSDPTQIWLDATEILYICSVPKCAMLAIIPALEELALLLQPVDHGVGVLLNAGGEDDESVPLAHLAEKFVAVGTFVDVVEDGVLRSDDGGVGGGVETNGCVELDFYHVP
jgi:hypothetical protein